jgi:hypothetical protein
MAKFKDSTRQSPGMTAYGSKSILSHIDLEEICVKVDLKTATSMATVGTRDGGQFFDQGCKVLDDASLSRSVSEDLILTSSLSTL